jgi:outer membrane protein assembly factor BamB
MRTTWVRAVVAAFALLAAAGCDWVQYRGDAAHTGTVVEVAIGAGNVGDLEQLWSVTVGDPATPRPVRDPVVAGGVAVAGSGLALRAVDAASGASRWAYAFPAPTPELQPSVTGPGMADGAVLVGYTGPFTSGGVTGRVARFDLATGAELPPLDDHTTIDLGVSSPVAVTGAGDVWFSGGVVCPLVDCKFTGIEGVLASGRTVAGLRATPPAEQPAGPPAVGDGVAVVVGGDGIMRAYDAAGVEGCTLNTQVNVFACTELWTAPVGTIGGTPVISDGYVILVAGTQVVAVEIAGPPGTRTPVPIADVAGGTVPAVSAEGLFVGSADGLVAVVPDCAPICTWQGDTGAPVASAPTVANGVVYVASTDGNLHAFSAAGCPEPTCAPLWSAATPGVATSSPVVANGRVYVGTSTGQLVAYGLP